MLSTLLYYAVCRILLTSGHSICTMHVHAFATNASCIPKGLFRYLPFFRKSMVCRMTNISNYPRELRRPSSAFWPIFNCLLSFLTAYCRLLIICRKEIVVFETYTTLLVSETDMSTGYDMKCLDLQTTRTKYKKFTYLCFSCRL